jgi:hypothetical protein
MRIKTITPEKSNDGAFRFLVQFFDGPAVEVSAQELLSYRTLQKAVLEQTGQLFRNIYYELESGEEDHARWQTHLFSWLFLHQHGTLPFRLDCDCLDPRFSDLQHRENLEETSSRVNQESRKAAT